MGDRDFEIGAPSARREAQLEPPLRSPSYSLGAFLMAVGVGLLGSNVLGWILFTFVIGDPWGRAGGLGPPSNMSWSVGAFGAVLVLLGLASFGRRVVIASGPEGLPQRSPFAPSVDPIWIARARSLGIGAGISLVAYGAIARTEWWRACGGPCDDTVSAPAPEFWVGVSLLVMSAFAIAIRRHWRRRASAAP